MTTASDQHLTPAMRQFFRFKKQHPGCVLFFRMGDFYEMFYDDAKLAHKVLGVTLTQRTEGVPMAGVPYHAVEGYLRRMIQAGHRVAVCEQVEDPRQARGVVERDVTRVITPGTLTDDTLLDEAAENPLASVVFHSDDEASLAWAELSTGSFSVATLPVDQLLDELARIAPRELVYCDTATGETPPRIAALAEPLGCALAGRPAWQFRLGEAIEVLQRQYGVAGLGGFGFADDDPALAAAGAVVHYLLETQRTSETGRLAHLRPPKRFTRAAHLVIDATSLRSLEVERTMRSGGVKGSLLDVLQDCATPMGKRLLRNWLCYPLAERAAIEARQAIVASLVDDERFLDEASSAIDGVQDIPRITSRLAVDRATPRDLVALGQSARRARDVERALADRPSVAPFHARVAGLVEALEALAGEVEASCVEAPPAHLREGGLFRDGCDAALDEYRSLQRDANTWLANYQKSLIEESGIPSLKVGYNKVFGYYIEVTAAHRPKLDGQPDLFRTWSRKQTLKNAERFITPDLKAFEEKVLSAESRAIAREQELFTRLCGRAQQQMAQLHAFAEAVAEFDVLACFARRAVRCRYVRPTIVDEPVLHIDAGRHPVLDELLGDRFVPNDLVLQSRGMQSRGMATPRLSNDSNEHEHERDHDPDAAATLALITGPNMAGKSTYIRQAALITLLSHTGSFVPADRATVGVCDRIFTRIGASDEIHAGQSTFMVEMTEAANICHHATAASLVVLDEIGRGTSTLDGLSIAWAIAEHLARRQCRTLFATHYHEITSLSERFPNVANLNVTVREWQDQIVFLHRIAPGKADRSYGIHVAKIAGMPPEVVARANALLAELAVSHNGSVSRDAARRARRQPEPQLSLFTEYVDHPALARLRDMRIESLSPLEAFDLLRQLHAQAQGPTAD
jgi:DNA mismatch repair protein MutS